jgi:hypothetical protein
MKSSPPITAVQPCCWRRDGPATETDAIMVQAKVPFPLQVEAQVIAAIKPRLSARTRA